MNTPADAFLTAEGIELKQTYPEQDIENIKHLDFGAGFAPNLRGPYATMCADLDCAPICRIFYCRRKQCFYRRNLAAGQKDFPLDFRHTAGLITTRDVGKQELRLTLWKT
jgi:methylmalonyl-CoA mutase